MSYRLSRKAEDDLIQIYVAGTRGFGAAQAERYYAGLETAFAFLADYPQAARERVEILPPVRIHPYRSHVIVYVVDDEGVLILRVRHGREDWESQPSDDATDP
jgi:toxin ParE1/3/4